MDYKKLWWTCLYLTIVVSVIMFFLVPKYEFIPKLLYLAIAVGFAVWHVVQRMNQPLSAGLAHCWFS